MQLDDYHRKDIQMTWVKIDDGYLHERTASTDAFCGALDNAVVVE